MNLNTLKKNAGKEQPAEKHNLDKLSPVKYMSYADEAKVPETIIHTICNGTYKKTSYPDVNTAREAWHKAVQSKKGKKLILIYNRDFIDLKGRLNICLEINTSK